MKLLKKVFLIVSLFSCFSSFALRDNYSSMLKTSQVRTFSEFENNIKKDMKQIVREVAGKPVLVFIEEQKEEKASKKLNPSTI